MNDITYRYKKNMYNIGFVLGKQMVNKTKNTRYIK